MSYPYDKIVKINTYINTTGFVPNDPDPAPVLRTTKNGAIRTTLKNIQRAVKSKE